MYAVRKGFLWLCIFLFAGFLASCTQKGIPPGANTIYGGADEARFSYHYWEEGLAILFWHDFVRGEEGCTGSSSSEDPVFRLECDVRAEDGQTFSWKAHSRDGVTADLWIDGQAYDLSQGTLFLVSHRDNGFRVSQLQRDFSGLEPNNETIAALARSDPDIANFIASTEGESELPGADNQPSLAELAESGVTATPMCEPNLSYEAAVYRNEADNFELCYPAAWDISEQVFGPRAYGGQFYSEDELVFSAIVFLWDPKNDLDSYVDLRKQGWSSSSTVVSEGELALVDGRRAFQFEIRGPDGSNYYSLLTEVGEKYLELAGPFELAEFGEIVQTFRPIDTSTSEPTE